MSRIFKRCISILCTFAMLAVYVPVIETMAAEADIYTDNFDGYTAGNLPLKDNISTENWHSYNNSRGFSQWTPKVAANPTVSTVPNTDNVLVIDKHTDSESVKNEYLEVDLNRASGKIKVEFDICVPSPDTCNEIGYTGYNTNYVRGNNQYAVRIGLIDADLASLWLSDIDVHPQNNSKPVFWWDNITMRQFGEEGYGQWYKAGFDVDTSAGTIDATFEGNVIKTYTIDTDTELGQLRIVAYGQMPKSVMYINNLKVVSITDDPVTPPTDPTEPTDPTPTVPQDIISYADILNGQMSTNVTSALNLPTAKDEYTISWLSSSPSVNVTDGAVTPAQYADTTVKLTAEIRDSSSTLVDTKVFYVVVAARNQEVKFTESFATAPTGASTPIAINKTAGHASNYGGWTLYSSATSTTYANAKAEGTEINVIKEPESVGNNVMHIVRASRSGTPLRVSNPIMPALDSGIVSIKMRYKAKSDAFGFNFFSTAKVIEFFEDSWSVNGTKVSDYTAKAIDTWHIAEFVLNYDEDKADLYIDGEKIGSTYQGTVPMLSDMNFCHDGSYEPGECYIDDIIVAKAIEPDYINFADIANGQPASGITSELNLLTTKTIDSAVYNIEWLSSDNTLIASDGTVTPAPYGDKIVTLTAKITRASDGVLVKTKTFDVVVIAADELYFSNFTYEDTFEDYAIGNLPYGGVNKWSDYNNRTFVQWTPRVAEDPSGTPNKVMAIDKADGTIFAFYIAANYQKALDANNVDAIKPNVDLGRLVHISFNKFGRAAFISTLTNNDGYRYGYLNAWGAKGAISIDAQFEILTLNNKFEIFENEPGEKIRFGRQDSSYKTSSETPGEVLKKLHSKQLVKYKLDEKGYLTELNLAGSTPSKEHFSIGPVASDTSLNYRDNVLDLKYYIDQNTAVFDVNSSGQYEHLMSAGKYTSYFSNGANKSCTLYDVEGGYVKAIVLSASAVTLYEKEEDGYEVILDNVNSPLLYISKVTSELGANGESYTCLHGFQNGESYSVFVAKQLNKNSESAANLKPGIVIQYENNNIYRQRASTSDEPEQVILFKTVFDFTAPQSEDIFWDYKNVPHTRPQILTMWGPVTSADEGYCTLTINSGNHTAHIHENTMVLRYDSVKKEFVREAIDAVNVGQRVFVRQRYLNTREAVIY